MSQYTSIPNDTIIEETAKNLEENGINVIITKNKDEAKKEALNLIPKDAEVMDMTSVTLSEISLQKELNESGNYSPVKEKLSQMDRETQNREMQQMGAAPEYAIGSVHAVTEDGKVLIASNTGSQLPAYVYGSERVIWVVGAQKIVKDVDQGMKRIYDYVLPLESERARKAYGMKGSNVSKILMFNKEINPDRITLILVKEKLGY